MNPFTHKRSFKTTLVLAGCILWGVSGSLFFVSSTPWASELTDGFSEKYQSLVPRENSSVGSDYLFEQMALGSEYTIRALDMIHSRSTSLNDKVDLMLEKYDELIRQNREIIKLLEKISRKPEASE